MLPVPAHELLVFEAMQRVVPHSDPYLDCGISQRVLQVFCDGLACKAIFVMPVLFTCGCGINGVQIPGLFIYIFIYKNFSSPLRLSISIHLYTYIIYRFIYK